MSIFEQHEPRTYSQQGSKAGYETASFKQFDGKKYKLVRRTTSESDKEDIISQLRTMGYDSFRTDSNGRLYVRKDSWGY